jgi:hypothetical protein
MNVHLVDAPSSGYLEVNVDVQSVQINGGDGWVVLGQPNRVVNLLALTGGVSETLVDGATLPAGHYGQMRLVLGSRNTVKLLDGTIEPLTVPSGQQSGVKLVVSFDVRPGTTSDVFIDFDAHNSIFVHEAGASGKYMLRPTVRAFDRTVTGSISGTLTVDGSTTALPGVVVTAQTVGATGPALVRSTTTNAAGHYVLDLLPIGGTYYAVSQPVITDVAGSPVTSYVPEASAAISLTTAAPTGTWDAAFATAPAIGAVTGAVTPAAVIPQVDMVQARFSLATGGTTQTLIVRTTPASVTTTGESYGFQALPVATTGTTTYSVVLERRSIDASGAETVQTTAPASVAVAPGSTTTADIAVTP